MTAHVMDYATGKKLGEVNVSGSFGADYATGTHQGFQWPEGIAKAGDILTEVACERLGIPLHQVIWFEV